MDTFNTPLEKKIMNLAASAIAGVTIMLTDMFLDPFFAANEIFRLLKFLAQGAIVLWVNDMFDS